jgi:hypothetical protein
MVNMANVSDLKTSNYTIVPIDDIIAIGNLNSNITITLPSVPNLGDQYTVKDVVGTLGNYKVTLSGDGYFIDGASDKVLAQAFAACTVTFTGTQWGVTWSYEGKGAGNGFGSLNNRPIQGQAGRTYYANDESVFYFDDGNKWQSIGPNIKTLKTPKVSDFTWVNQNGAVANDTGSGIYLQSLGFNMGVHNASMLVKTAPPAPYTINVGFLYCGMNGFDYKNGPVGLCFRNSVDEKIHSYTIDFNNAGIAKIASTYYGRHDVFMYDYLERESNFAASIMWFRIRQDNVNRYLEYSRDGINYTNFHFIGKNFDMSADQVGFFINPLFQDVKVTIVSWEEY